MDGGMPEYYAYILANDRKIFHEFNENKAIIDMDFQEIANIIWQELGRSIGEHDGFLKHLEVNLNVVKKFHVERTARTMRDFYTHDDIQPWEEVERDRYLALIRRLENWDIDDKGWKLMNWNKNPFQTK